MITIGKSLSNSSTRSESSLLPSPIHIGTHSAQNLGLPYLSAYSDVIGANFRRGANFATGGSSIKPGGYSPFHLDHQVSQFIQFKSRTTNLYNETTTNSNNTAQDISCKICTLPRSNEFLESFYMFDIGQNDLTIGFMHSYPEQVQESNPEMINMLSHSLHQLYEDEARFFWVHNTGPHGCIPIIVFNNRNNPENFDSVECVRSQNEVAMEFNRQKESPSSESFGDPMKVCYGSYEGGVHIDCGKSFTPNGTVIYGKIYTDPSKHISWDGTHYTDATNLYFAKLIVSGLVSDPKIPIHDSCSAVTDM